MNIIKIKLKEEYEGLSLNKEYDAFERPDGMLIFTSPDWLLIEKNDYEIIDPHSICINCLHSANHTDHCDLSFFKLANKEISGNEFINKMTYICPMFIRK